MLYACPTWQVIGLTYSWDQSELSCSPIPPSPRQHVASHVGTSCLDKVPRLFLIPTWHGRMLTWNSYSGVWNVPGVACRTRWSSFGHIGLVELVPTYSFLAPSLPVGGIAPKIWVFLNGHNLL